jgi:hypothetical protein
VVDSGCSGVRVDGPESRLTKISCPGVQATARPSGKGKDMHGWLHGSLHSNAGILGSRRTCEGSV